MIKFFLRPVIFDGCMYVGIAVFGYLNTTFGGEEAAKFIHAVALFWIKVICGAFAAGFLAVKMYRSTTFAEYRQAMNGSFHTPADEPPLATQEPPQPAQAAAKPVINK